ncbi:glucosamine-6-phosphate deaminase [soil metagenome]
MSRIQLQIETNPDAVARAAAAMIAAQLRANPASVLGFATGSTPEKTYTELIRLHREEGLSFGAARSFNLDEYVGMSGDHPQSYRAFMQQKLFDHIDIRPWNTHVLDGLAKDADAECAAFEKKILAAGGVDLWLLGIGNNGHIAFNEPGSAADSRTRRVPLSESTIAANSDGRFFARAEDVPRHALTAGIGTILEARRIVLIATGAKKSPALLAALNGPRTQECPASLLQNHGDYVFVVDKEAARKG